MRYLHHFDKWTKVTEEKRSSGETLEDLREEGNKIENWLKSLDVKYKRSSVMFTGAPQFFIYPDLAGTLTIEYSETRTKKKTAKSSGFYGDYHETGKYSWHLSWYDRYSSSSSSNRKASNLRVIKKDTEEYLQIVHYFKNILDFMISVGCSEKILDSTISSSLKSSKKFSITYSTGYLILEIRHSHEDFKSNIDAFGVWYSLPKQSGKFTRTNLRTGECLLLVYNILRERGEFVIPENVGDYLEKNKDKPIEDVLNGIKHILRGKIASKKFLS